MLNNFDVEAAAVGGFGGGIIFDFLEVDGESSLSPFLRWADFPLLVTADAVEDEEIADSPFDSEVLVAVAVTASRFLLPALFASFLSFAIIRRRLIFS